MPECSQRCTQAHRRDSCASRSPAALALALGRRVALASSQLWEVVRLTVLGISIQATDRTEYSGSTATAFLDAIVEGTTVVKARGKDAASFSAGTLTADQLGRADFDGEGTRAADAAGRAPGHEAALRRHLRRPPQERVP